MPHGNLPPVTPGEILEQEFLKPLKITQYRLAKDISVPPRRINEIIHGTRAVTADTALRLARYFKMSERFWLNLQAHHDIELAKERLGGNLEREVRVRTYHPPRLTIQGKKVFVHLEDGRIVRVTPKSVEKYGEVLAEALIRYFDAQGKLEAYVRAMEEFLKKNRKILPRKPRDQES